MEMGSTLACQESGEVRDKVQHPDQQMESFHLSLGFAFLFQGDMSSRHFKPEIRVSSLRFSPTGKCRALACF